MGLQVKGRIDPAASDRAAAHVLGLLGLADRLDYLPANLSGGQKQRVAIGRAIVGNPDVVLADEPTAALDWDAAARVVDLLRRLGQARGTTTVMVTHDNRILDRADRILTLEDGRLVGDEDRRA
jgi:putative ABC transport system ATP-binding protein